MSDFNTADKEVEVTYKNLARIAKEVVSEKTKAVDDIIAKLSCIERISDEDVRKYMLALSIECYSLGEVKEHSELKNSCATALMKEAQAVSYNESTGTAEARKNKALVDSSGEVSVNILYSAVSGLMKTKLDEAHRVVATLNSVLISRASAAKLNANDRNTLE